MEDVKQKSQRSLKNEGSFNGYCYYCHKFGHKVVGCKIKRKDLSKEFKKLTRSVSKVPHGKIWRRKEDSKDIEETKISNIERGFQDDEGFNNVVDMIEIHYDRNKDDEEEITDSDGTEDGCLF